jgi:hypothetical protein
MKMRDDYPRDIPTQVAPCSGGPGLPRLIGRRVIVAGIDERPAVLALDEVDGDKAQRKGYRQLELVDPLDEARDLPDGLRAELRGGYAVSHRWLILEVLEDPGGTHAPTDAHGDHAVLRASALHLVNELDGQLGPGGAHRMA